ncbi:unnamed protein product [Boreogadus saida]
MSCVLSLSLSQGWDLTITQAPAPQRTTGLLCDSYKSQTFGCVTVFVRPKFFFYFYNGGDIVKDVEDMATQPLKHVSRLTFDIQRELAVTICCPFKAHHSARVRLCLDGALVCG